MDNSISNLKQEEGLDEGDKDDDLDSDEKRKKEKQQDIRNWSQLLQRANNNYVAISQAVKNLTFQKEREQDEKYRETIENSRQEYIKLNAQRVQEKNKIKKELERLVMLKKGRNINQQGSSKDHKRSGLNKSFDIINAENERIGLIKPLSFVEKYISYFKMSQGESITKKKTNELYQKINNNPYSDINQQHDGIGVQQKKQPLFKLINPKDKHVTFLTMNNPLQTGFDSVGYDIMLDRDGKTLESNKLNKSLNMTEYTQNNQIDPNQQRLLKLFNTQPQVIQKQQSPKSLFRANESVASLTETSIIYGLQRGHQQDLMSLKSIIDGEGETPSKHYRYRSLQEPSKNLDIKEALTKSFDQIKFTDITKQKPQERLFNKLLVQVNQQYGFDDSPNKYEVSMKQHRQKVREARANGKTTNRSLDATKQEARVENSLTEKLKRALNAKILNSKQEFTADKDNIHRYNKYLNKVMLLNSDDFIANKFKIYLKKTKAANTNGQGDFFHRMTLDIVNRKKEEENGQNS